MASNEESCENNPDFAVICSFITKFGVDCGVQVTISALKLMLEDTKNAIPDELKEMHIHLLRKGKKRVNKEKWERSLIKFCHEYSSIDAWELERFGYKKAKLSVKLSLLKRLLELQFDSNAKFKAEVNKQDATKLRVLPIGRDVNGCMYWYQLDKDCNMRLYRQDVTDESSWSLLCSTKEDLKDLIIKLSQLSDKNKDELFDLIKMEPLADESSDKVPLDEEMKDETENRSSDELRASISLTNPCAIIIKTEKKDVDSEHKEVEKDVCLSPVRQEDDSLVNQSETVINRTLKDKHQNTLPSSILSSVITSLSPSKELLTATQDPLEMDVSRIKIENCDVEESKKTELLNKEVFEAEEKSSTVEFPKKAQERSESCIKSTEVDLSKASSDVPESRTEKKSAAESKLSDPSSQDNRCTKVDEQSAVEEPTSFRDSKFKRYQKWSKEKQANASPFVNDSNYLPSEKENLINLAPTQSVIQNIPTSPLDYSKSSSENIETNSTHTLNGTVISQSSEAPVDLSKPTTSSVDSVSGTVPSLPETKTENSSKKVSSKVLHSTDSILSRPFKKKHLMMAENDIDNHQQNLHSVICEVKKDKIITSNETSVIATCLSSSADVISPDKVLESKINDSHVGSLNLSISRLIEPSETKHKEALESTESKILNNSDSSRKEHSEIVSNHEESIQKVTEAPENKLNFNSCDVSTVPKIVSTSSDSNCTNHVPSDLSIIDKLKIDVNSTPSEIKKSISTTEDIDNTCKISLLKKDEQDTDKSDVIDKLEIPTPVIETVPETKFDIADSLKNDQQLDKEKSPEQCIVTEPSKMECLQEQKSRPNEESEHAKSVESEHAKSVESEHSKSVESEHAKSIESEHAKPVESEHAKPVESEHAKSVESEHEKSVEPEHEKSVEPEHTKSVESSQEAQIDEQQNKECEIVKESASHEPLDIKGDTENLFLTDKKSDVSQVDLETKHEKTNQMETSDLKSEEMEVDTSDKNKTMVSSPKNKDGKLEMSPVSEKVEPKDIDISSPIREKGEDTHHVVSQTSQELPDSSEKSKELMKEETDQQSIEKTEEAKPEDSEPSSNSTDIKPQMCDVLETNVDQEKCKTSSSEEIREEQGASSDISIEDDKSKVVSTSVQEPVIKSAPPNAEVPETPTSERCEVVESSKDQKTAGEQCDKSDIEKSPCPDEVSCCKEATDKVPTISVDNITKSQPPKLELNIKDISEDQKEVKEEVEAIEEICPKTVPENLDQEPIAKDALESSSTTDAVIAEPPEKVSPMNDKDVIDEGIDIKTSKPDSSKSDQSLLQEKDAISDSKDDSKEKEAQVEDSSQTLSKPQSVVEDKDEEKDELCEVTKDETVSIPETKEVHDHKPSPESDKILIDAKQDAQTENSSKITEDSIMKTSSDLPLEPAEKLANNEKFLDTSVDPETIKSPKMEAESTVAKSDVEIPLPTKDVEELPVLDKPNEAESSSKTDVDKMDVDDPEDISHKTKDNQEETDIIDAKKDLSIEKDEEKKPETKVNQPVPDVDMADEPKDCISLEKTDNHLEGDQLAESATTSKDKLKDNLVPEEGKKDTVEEMDLSEKEEQKSPTKITEAFKFDFFVEEDSSTTTSSCVKYDSIPHEDMAKRYEGLYSFHMPSICCETKLRSHLGALGWNSHIAKTKDHPKKSQASLIAANILEKLRGCNKDNLLEEEPKVRAKSRRGRGSARGRGRGASRKQSQTNKQSTSTPKRGRGKPRGRSRRGQSRSQRATTDVLPEGLLEIFDSSNDNEPLKSSKSHQRSKSDQLSQPSSENESQSTRKRSTRIQAQNQKKMSELAVQMQKEQQRLENLAKKKKVTPVKKEKVKPVKTPTKSIFDIPDLDDSDTKQGGRRKRKMRSVNMAKLALMYDDESKDSEQSTSRSTEKSRRRKSGRGRRKGGSFKPWDLSSESSTTVEEPSEEEVEEEEEEQLVFNANEDEFACEEVEEDAEPVVVRRARTAKKEIENENESECTADDKPCSKCGKFDRPEWILLCDKCNEGYHTNCLIPPLFNIPDGDWFCQPCEHLFLCKCLNKEFHKLEQMLKQKEREELRKQRLAYVGISLDNVLKIEKKESESESEEVADEEEKPVKRHRSDHRHHSDDDIRKKVFGKRSKRARQKVNYQFKEYDELIASAIGDEILDFKIEEEYEQPPKSEEEKPSEDDSYIGSPPSKRKKKLNDLDYSGEDDSGDDYKGLSTDTEHTPSVNTEVSQSGSDAASGEWRIVKAKPKAKRKPRKRRRGGGGKYTTSEEEDFESDASSYRPTTRRAAQKQISYRELSSEDEEWGSVKKSQKRKKKDTSSEDSEVSYKTSKKKKARSAKWGGSSSSESEAEMSERDTSESEGSESKSEGEWKIDKKSSEGGRIKLNINKKIIESDDSDSSEKEVKPKKRANRLVSDGSEEGDNDEEDDDDDDDEEEDEEDSDESTENSDSEASKDEKSNKSLEVKKKLPSASSDGKAKSEETSKSVANTQKRPGDRPRMIFTKSTGPKGVIKTPNQADPSKPVAASTKPVDKPTTTVTPIRVEQLPSSVAAVCRAVANREHGSSSQIVVKTVVVKTVPKGAIKEIKMVPSKIQYKDKIDSSENEAAKPVASPKEPPKPEPATTVAITKPSVIMKTVSSPQQAPTPPLKAMPPAVSKTAPPPLTKDQGPPPPPPGHAILQRPYISSPNVPPPPQASSPLRQLMMSNKGSPVPPSYPGPMMRPQSPLPQHHLYRGPHPQQRFMPPQMEAQMRPHPQMMPQGMPVRSSIPPHVYHGPPMEPRGMIPMKQIVMRNMLPAYSSPPLEPISPQPMSQPPIQSAKQGPHSNQNYPAGSIVEPFSSVDQGSDSRDEVPLERIPEAENAPATYANKGGNFENEYRPAKEVVNYQYNVPEEKNFPTSYSPLSSLQEFTSRPSPLKPSLVETFSSSSSPTRLTTLDSYPQNNSPKGFISLDSYPSKAKPGTFRNVPESESRPEAYQGESRFLPENYPSSPSVQNRDPGTPPRLYSQFPDNYPPPRSPEYYQGQQYYPPEEGMPRASFQGSYNPEQGASYTYMPNNMQQPNDGFMIDTILRARNEEDELDGR